MDSLKQKGQIESVIIKEDKTIVSGHRRWLALKAMGADKIRCEVRAFDDELDEWETLIECNKQREKTRIQRANEIDKLRKIKAERARRKQEASGIYGVGSGRPKKEDEKTLVQNSVQGFSGNDKPASTFHHTEPSPTTTLENIATIKIVTNGQVTGENQSFCSSNAVITINPIDGTIKNNITHQKLQMKSSTNGCFFSDNLKTL